MAAGSRFRHLFTNSYKQRRVFAGLVGASATWLTYVWHDTYYNCINAEETRKSEDGVPLETSLSEEPQNPKNETHALDNECTKQPETYKTHNAVFFNTATVNDKYRKVAPKLFEIIHQAKELCGTPGISYAVSHNGELVMKGGIGLADVESYTLITSQTLLRIASISKSLTTVAVGKLVEEGLIDLNKPVQTYVSKFPLKKFDEEDVTITLKQLMSHTSGIRGYFDGKRKKGDKPEPLDDKAKRKHAIEVKKYGEDCVNSNENYIKEHYDTVAAGLKLFEDDPLIYKPGEDYEYSSLAYSLVSRAIEEVSGKDYPTYMKKICKDVGMHSTRVDLNDPITFKRSSNYDRKEDRKLKNVPYVDNSYKWSGGGFLSNVEDLLKLGNVMLLSSQTDQGYLKQSTVATLWHPQPITFGKYQKEHPEKGYALGWAITLKGNDEKYTVSHGGGAVGVTSILMIVPSEDGERVCDTITGTHPRGTVVALIANMQSAPGIRDASLRISKCLDEHLESTNRKEKIIK